MNLSGEFILQLITSLCATGVLGAVINFVLIRPKVRAEAASMATAAVETVLVRLTAENERLGRRVDELERDHERDHAERHLIDQWAWRLQSWANRAYDELHRLGSQIEPPPQREERP